MTAPLPAPDPRVRVSGFTIVRNAVRLDFPVVESLRSILPLCDELVVNVGRSDDDTLGLVKGLGDPRLRVLETDWDLGRGHRLLAEQTWAAMRACRGTWGLYIQADEVLHESGLTALRAAMTALEPDPRVEGLLVRYRHFYGHPDLEAVHRHWYRREVRVVRLDPALDIHPFRDAQGFRVGPRDRRIRARLVDAEIFHYGWTRSAAALRTRRVDDQRLYGRSAAASDPAVLPWFPGLRPFRGPHPAVAHDWVARHRDDPDRRVAEPRFAWRHLRYRASDLIERITGARVFEFRNYSRV